MSLSIGVGGASTTRNTLSPSTSFQIRQPSLKGKEKEIEIQPVKADVVIDIQSSSSQKNEFSKALEELIDKFKTVEGESVNETKITALKKEQSQRKMNIIREVILGTVITGVALGFFAGGIKIKNKAAQFTCVLLGVMSLATVVAALKDAHKNFTKKKEIKQQIQDLRSQPPQITPQQINDVFLEAFDAFFPDEAEKDNKKFVHFFNEHEIGFLANTTRIILEQPKNDWHLTLRDNILALEHKQETTKEDFLDVIAKNIISILISIPEIPEKERKFIQELLNTAQKFVIKETTSETKE